VTAVDKRQKRCWPGSACRPRPPAELGRQRRRADTDRAGEPQRRQRARCTASQVSAGRRRRTPTICQGTALKLARSKRLFARFRRLPNSDIFAPQSLRTRREEAARKPTTGCQLADPCLDLRGGEAVMGLDAGRCTRANAMLRNNDNSHRLGGPVARRGGALSSDGGLPGHAAADAVRAPETTRALHALQTLAESAACEADLCRAIIEP
jgi:hypothetical protein